jgi:hypothetical protein
MFDKIGRAAERAAEGVSRRNFLGRLGRGAAVLATGLGGILLTATGAHAGGGNWCCLTWDSASSGPTCVKGRCSKNSGTLAGGGGGFGTVRCSDYPEYCPQ